MGNMGEISTAATGMQEKLLNGLRCVPLAASPERDGGSCGGREGMSWVVGSCVSPQ